MRDDLLQKVRVRIAPSPTGDPHVGTAYIALFNYVFAKKSNGDFIIRIEDTDRTRFSETSEQGILKYLKWLELKWDEGPDVGGDKGPYKQSEREYSSYAYQLIDAGHAYRCFCTEDRLEKLRDYQVAKKLPPGYDGFCRKLSKEDIREKLAFGHHFIIRLKVPQDGVTIVEDKLRGNIEFVNSKIDDQVLLKSDGMPTYHLANVVDDHLMEITHVIRAEEWIPSTPKHVILYKAFGWDIPVWVHMPLLRNSDKSKISKRKNDVSLEFYYNEGYLKEAMLNFLALMGWHPKDNQEIFSLDYMIKNFDFKDLHLGGPIFDIQKLRWINREYLKNYDNNKLMSLMNLEYSELLNGVLNLLKGESYTLLELKGKVAMLMNNPLQNISNLDNKEEALAILSNGKPIIEYLTKAIEMSNVDLRDESGAKTLIDDLKQKFGSKNLFHVIRLALIGSMTGTEVAKILVEFPKIEILRRLRAIDV